MQEIRYVCDEYSQDVTRLLTFVICVRCQRVRLPKNACFFHIGILKIQDGSNMTGTICV